MASSSSFSMSDLMLSCGYRPEKRHCAPVDTEELSSGLQSGLARTEEAVQTGLARTEEAMQSGLAWLQTLTSSLDISSLDMTAPWGSGESTASAMLPGTPRVGRSIMLAAQAAARHENGLEANRVGHFRKALALFRNAVELRCSADGVVAADSLISAANMHFKLGERTDAVALYQQALGLPNLGEKQRLYVQKKIGLARPTLPTMSSFLDATHARAIDAGLEDADARLVCVRVHVQGARVAVECIARHRS